MRIAALKQSLAAVLASMEAVVAGAMTPATAEAPEEPRYLTAEEQGQYDALKTKATGLQASIRREEEILALKASAASPVIVPGGNPANPGAPGATGCAVDCDGIGENTVCPGAAGAPAWGPAGR